MGLLDWIDKGGERPKGVTRAQMKRELQSLGAEHRQDERLGMLRDGLGREPELSELKPEAKKNPCKKEQPKRVRVKSHDIPY